MTRKRLSAVLALALTAFFLWLATRHVDMAQLWASLSQAKPAWILVIAAIGLLDLLIRSVRWSLLLSGARPKASVWLLFRLEAVGIAVNNVLFMRIGELARAFLAARELAIPMATALASVAVERALDLAALLSLFSVASSFAPGLVPEALRRLALLGLGGVLAALTLLAVAEGPLSSGGWAERLLKRWPRIHDLIVQLALGAAVLRRPLAALAVGALSLSLWGVDALVFWVGDRALGLGGVVDYWRSVLVLSWSGAGAALPAAPGAFGTVEALVENILVKFGVDAPHALAFAVFTHVVSYVLVTALGLGFLYFIGLSLGELDAAVKTMDKGKR